MLIKDTGKVSIAVVGRPNVGKSSLFNVLLAKRKSLVSKEAGVTRDVVTGEYVSEELNFELVDTGGISYHIEHPFIADTIAFAKESIKKADIILFVVDAQAGITLDDEELAKVLRKERIDDVILLVNKVDHENHEPNAYEFYKLGFKEIFFVSCAHKRGIGDLKEILRDKIDILELSQEKPFIKPASSDSDENEDEKELSEDGVNLKHIKTVLLGKPNVGKSSFFNQVIGRSRAIISDIPGTTRDVLFENFTFNDYSIEIMDMAGFRRKNKINDALEQDSIKKGLWAIRQQSVVIILINALEEVSEQDKKLVQLVMKEKRAMIIGLNKWDLVPADKYLQANVLEQVKHDLALASFVPVIPISVKENQGIDKLLKVLIKVNYNFHKKISPREITVFMKSCIKKKPPFSKLGELKLFYGVQVSQNPPEFQFFVNNSLIVTKAYEQFLKNSIYEQFDLKGVPLFITFKNRH